MAAVTV